MCEFSIMVEQLVNEICRVDTRILDVSKLWYNLTLLYDTRTGIFASKVHKWYSVSVVEYRVTPT